MALSMRSDLEILPEDIERMSTRDLCVGCRNGEGFELEFTMAFQPIVNVQTRTVYAHEALVRGRAGEGAGSILGQVTDANRYAFDQACRVKAIELAAQLGMPGLLSINFLPNAVYDPRNCLRVTLSAAKRFDFPIEQILFEIAESEKVVDLDHVIRIVRAYERLGLTTAIDDFGAGWAGLNLLSEVRPQVVKLDRGLCHGLGADAGRQSIAKYAAAMAQELGIVVIAEGIEQEEDLEILRNFGIELFQGFLFARPALERLPEIHWP
jgi:EAL domain-containing protein (putative c-di-GMP-specific phosphodiesterase class I)